jgi:hypothetical protein
MEEVPGTMTEKDMMRRLCGHFGRTPGEQWKVRVRDRKLRQQEWKIEAG